MQPPARLQTGGGLAGPQAAAPLREPWPADPGRVPGGDTPSGAGSVGSAADDQRHWLRRLGPAVRLAAGAFRSSHHSAHGDPGQGPCVQATCIQARCEPDGSPHPASIARPEGPPAFLPRLRPFKRSRKAEMCCWLRTRAPARRWRTSCPWCAARCQPQCLHVLCGLRADNNARSMWMQSWGAAVLLARHCALASPWTALRDYLIPRRLGLPARRGCTRVAC